VVPVTPAREPEPIGVQQPVIPEAPPSQESVVVSAIPQASAVPLAAPAVGTGRPTSPFAVDVRPDGEAFINCIRRRGTPARVHFVELFLDGEVQDELCRRFDILRGLDPADPFFPERRAIAIQRFLGYDYVVCGLEGLVMPRNDVTTDDTAALAREGGRTFVDEHKGPITTMEEYESYPWPAPEALTSRALEWYERNLPDDMCVIGGLCGHFAENLSWLMGYETLCYALYEDRELVSRIARRTLRIDREVVKRLCQFDRVKAIWGSDDMGYRSGTLIAPDDMREFVLPGHRILASFAHMHGRPYLLHSCGKLDEIMEDLIGNVRIDAKHSFEDTIEDVRDAKRKYGARLALLGGIDVDFLCRADEDAVRMRVRSTLATCQAGGGYCLGTGNSVANYIPVENYLAMLDEGRKYGR
jgi:uroporphyrinogen decarboxylase